MKDQPTESMEKGFCTFCMGSYEPLRIGAHVRRCRDRVDDANCIQTDGREHPMAFLLMVGIEGWPEAWLCLEAHCQAHLSDLDLFIRYTWFPEIKEHGVFFFPERILRKRVPENVDTDLRLDQLLKVKECFSLVLRRGRSAVKIDLNVVGHLRTAIMHRPVDVAAFPLNSQGGRLPAGSGRVV